MRLTPATARPRRRSRPGRLGFWLRRRFGRRGAGRGIRGRLVALGAAVMLVVAALVLVVPAVPAQAAPAAGAAVAGSTVRVLALAGSVGAVLDNVRNWIMGILAGLATVFLTIGGLRYVLAAGDPGEVSKAKLAFKSAGMGYALAALAPLVVTVLKGIVGA